MLREMRRIRMSLALAFTSRVLGPKAVEQLKDGKVLQTIRSRKEAAPFLTKQGSEVPLTLDGNLLYRVRITAIRRTTLAELIEFDAELGGFQNLWEFRQAARRAGFRFRPFEEYEVFAIQFQKVRSTKRGDCAECGKEIPMNAQYFKDDDDNFLCYDCGWPESEEGQEVLEG